MKVDGLHHVALVALCDPVAESCQHACVLLPVSPAIFLLKVLGMLLKVAELLAGGCQHLLKLLQ